MREKRSCATDPVKESHHAENFRSHWPAMPYCELHGTAPRREGDPYEKRFRDSPSSRLSHLRFAMFDDGTTHRSDQDRVAVPPWLTSKDAKRLANDHNTTRPAIT